MPSPWKACPSCTNPLVQELPALLRHARLTLCSPLSGPIPCHRTPFCWKTAPGIQSFVTLALEDMPVVLHCCASLQAARALLREHGCRLVLADMHLPDGNGLELLTQLCQHNQPPSTASSSARHRPRPGAPAAAARRAPCRVINP